MGNIPQQERLFDTEAYDERFHLDREQDEKMIQACLDADHILIMFSGGKDSTASLLRLIEAGVPLDRVELWHQCVDGRTVPGLSRENPMMDYACTVSYVESVARAFDIPLYFQWKDGGFEEEMLRENSATSRTFFETSEGLRWAGGESGNLNTRHKFPMQSNDLSRRWCSSYLKIQPAEASLRNQLRFRDAKTIYISGERAEESTNRSRYPDVCVHRMATKGGRNGKSGRRHITHWHPVLRWNERMVWDILERFKIRPHPCYDLHEAIGRCSCQGCIFASAMQWRILQEISPEKFEKIARYEREFNYTIVHGFSVVDLAASAPCPDLDPETVAMVTSRSFEYPIFTEKWEPPRGAYGNSHCGSS